MKKTDLNLGLLKQFIPFVNLNNERVRVAEKEDTFLHIVDMNPTSGFYFTIMKRSKKDLYTIEHRPQNEDYLTPVAQEVFKDNIGTEFQKWISLLNEYDATPTFFDDPILSAYADNYFEQFSANLEEPEKPLTPENVLQLEQTFQNLTTYLQSQSNKENEADISNIIEDINDLRDKTTQLSKKRVYQGVSKILAKTTKLLGHPFVKRLSTEFLVQFSVRLLLGS